VIRGTRLSISRRGSDEFFYLPDELKTGTEAMKIASNVVQALGEPCEGRLVRIAKEVGRGNPRPPSHHHIWSLA
jgi:hypothetical protein